MTAAGVGRALLVGVVAILLAERALELALNARHVAWLRARGARFEPRDGFGLILLSQAALFTLWPAEASLAPWAWGVGWWTWPLLALAALAQAVRYWVIATLGRRWSVRVVTLPGAPRIARGPYRFLPHPNYAVVLTESIVLPLAFGAWATAALVAPLHLVALRRRIRIEERALRDAEAAAPADPTTTATTPPRGGSSA